MPKGDRDFFIDPDLFKKIKLDPDLKLSGKLDLSKLFRSSDLKLPHSVARGAFDASSFSRQMDQARLPHEFDLAGPHVTIPANILSLIKPGDGRYTVKKAPIDLLFEGQPEDQEIARNLPYYLNVTPSVVALVSTEIPHPANPHANFQYFSVAYNQSGEAVKLYKTAEDGDFKTALAEFPDSTIFGRLRSSLAIPAPTAYERQAALERGAEFRRLKTTTEELQGIINRDIYQGSLHETSENQKDILNVKQTYSGWATAEEARYIATFGASECFITSIYDQTSRQGALAHIDALTDASASFNRDFDHIAYGRNKSDLKLRIALLGGGNGAVFELAKLYMAVQNFQTEGYPIELTVGSILTGQSQSLALDLADGKLLNYNPNPRLHFQDPMELQADHMAMGMRMGKTITNIATPRSK